MERFWAVEALERLAESVRYTTSLEVLLERQTARVQSTLIFLPRPRWRTKQPPYTDELERFDLD
jgi:hypothetical protein